MTIVLTVFKDGPCFQSYPPSWRLGVSTGTPVSQAGAPPASTTTTATAGS